MPRSTRRRGHGCRRVRGGRVRRRRDGGPPPRCRKAQLDELAFFAGAFFAADFLRAVDFFGVDLAVAFFADVFLRAAGAFLRAAGAFFAASLLLASIAGMVVAAAPLKRLTTASTRSSSWAATASACSSRLATRSASRPSCLLT